MNIRTLAAVGALALAGAGLAGCSVEYQDGKEPITNPGLSQPSARPLAADPQGSATAASGANAGAAAEGAAAASNAGEAADGAGGADEPSANPPAGYVIDASSSDDAQGIELPGGVEGITAPNLGGDYVGAVTASGDADATGASAAGTASGSAASGGTGAASGGTGAAGDMSELVNDTREMVTMAGNSLDCASGSVVIDKPGQLFAIKGDCQSVTVTAAGTTVVGDNVGTLTLESASSTIMLRSATAITASSTSSANSVLWESGQPQIDDQGTLNSLHSIENLF